MLAYRSRRGDKTGGMSSVRQALQSLLTSLLADPSVGQGYTLASMAFGGAIEVTLEQGGAGFVVWLRPSDDNTGCYRQTSRFKIGYRGNPPDQLAYKVVEALCHSVQVWESSLNDDAAAELFDGRAVDGSAAAGAALPYLEWLPVQAGLKPAGRTIVTAVDAARLVAEAHTSGLRVAVVDAGKFIAEFFADRPDLDQIVYTARSETALAAAVEAERSMIEGDRRGEPVTGTQVRALGVALGYPHCCIDAFIAVRDRSNAEIRFHALQQTPWHASSLLNDHIEGRALVSHAVCRYDCPASVAYARALLEEFARNSPAGAAQLAEAQAGVMVVIAREGSIRLIGGTSATAGLVRFAAVEAVGDGAHLDRWRTVLRAADGIEVLPDGGVRILRGGEEIDHQRAHPEEVQIRLFL